MIRLFRLSQVLSLESNPALIQVLQIDSASFSPIELPPALSPIANRLPDALTLEIPVAKDGHGHVIVKHNVLIFKLIGGYGCLFFGLCPT